MNENRKNILFGAAQRVRASKPFYQFDTGQQFFFEDEFRTGTEVHFEDGSVKLIIDNVVSIPSDLLNTTGDKKAWVHIVEPESGTTVKEILWKVEKKKKANDYVEPEEEQTFRQELQMILDHTEASAFSARSDANDARKSAENAGSAAKKAQNAAITAANEAIAAAENAGIAVDRIGEAEAYTKEVKETAKRIDEAILAGMIKGEPGDDYILTEDDKEEIADLAKNKINPDDFILKTLSDGREAISYKTNHINYLYVYCSIERSLLNILSKSGGAHGHYMVKGEWYTEYIDYHDDVYKLTVAAEKGIVVFTSEIDMTNFVNTIGDATEYLKKYTDGLKQDYEQYKKDNDQAVSGKIDKPSDAPTVGKVLKIKSVNDDGSFVCEWAEDSGGITLDDIPIASNAVHGLVKGNGNGSTGIIVGGYGAGIPSVVKASNDAIDKRSSQFLPIVPSNLEYAVKSVGDEVYEHKKGDWVLKGTLTKDAPILNVDLSNCSELIVTGRSNSTGQSNISYFTNQTLTLITSATGTGERYIFCSFEDIFNGFRFVNANYSSANNNGNRNGTLSASSNSAQKISEISKISLAAPSYITECNIEIYAR